MRKIHAKNFFLKKRKGGGLFVFFKPIFFSCIYPMFSFLKFKNEKKGISLEQKKNFSKKRFFLINFFAKIFPLQNWEGQFSWNPRCILKNQRDLTFFSPSFSGHFNPQPLIYPVQPDPNFWNLTGNPTGQSIFVLKKFFFKKKKILNFLKKKIIFFKKWIHSVFAWKNKKNF